ncbi:hypothetical protein EON67_10645 [archaeon]|nr:MAG: hypothetical protein EON67_10645 [archaeon]
MAAPAPVASPAPDAGEPAVPVEGDVKHSMFSSGRPLVRPPRGDAAACLSAATRTRACIADRIVQHGVAVSAITSSTWEEVLSATACPAAMYVPRNLHRGRVQDARETHAARAPRPALQA